MFKKFKDVENYVTEKCKEGVDVLLEDTELHEQVDLYTELDFFGDEAFKKGKQRA